MKRLRILGGILFATAVWFPASAAPRATVLSNVFKLPLPPAKQGAVYEVDVKLGLPAGVNITGTSGAPFSMSVTNDASIPSYIRIAAKVLPGATPSSFTMLVAINAPKGKVRSLAGNSIADLQLNAFPPFTSATATPKPGDRCVLLKQSAGKGTDIVGRGGSPNEGPTIEKYTEGADPHCKKGGGGSTTPPKTTPTSTEHDPCLEASPPAECRYNWHVGLTTPRTVSSSNVGARIHFHVLLSNTGVKEGPAKDGFLSFGLERMAVPVGSVSWQPTVEHVPDGCRSSEGNLICDVRALAQGERMEFDVDYVWTAAARRAYEKLKDEAGFPRDGKLYLRAHASISYKEICLRDELSCDDNDDSARILITP